MSRKGSSMRSAPFSGDSLHPEGTVLFVVGTDTEVGKTRLVEELIRFSSERSRLKVVKAVQTGVDSPGETPDSGRYLRAGLAPEQVWEGYRFARPLDPMTAARLEGRRIDPELLSDRIRRFHDEGLRVVVEGAGGILSPFFPDGTGILSLMRHIDRPMTILLVSHPHLGTLSSTLAAVRILGEEGLPPRALLLCHRPGVRDDAATENPQTLRSLLSPLPVYEFA